MCLSNLQESTNKSTTADLESSSTSECSTKKKCAKRVKDDGVSNILSGAAESMEKLVQAVTNRKTTTDTATEPSDDDWLFCKRLYLKLKSLPDSHQKEMFKLNCESQLIRMTYGDYSNMHPIVRQQQQVINQRYDCGESSNGQYYESGQYTQL